ncbi:MAG: O-antigen ligase family protein, partial [Gemmatimonadota bacterium]
GGRPRLIAIALALGAIAAIVLPNQLAWRSSSPYADTLAGLANHEEGSGHGRLLQYRNTIKLAAKHPLLGVGPGGWPTHYAEAAPPSDPTWVFGDVVPINPWPSSDWMALLSELGVAAFVTALIFGGAIGWRGWRAAMGKNEQVLAGGALLALLVTAFIEGNLDAVLLLLAPLLLMAISAGVLLHLCEPGASAATAARPRIWGLLPIVLGIVTLRSMLQTAAYIVAGNGKTTSRLVWAARIDPGSYPIRIALAQRLSCAEARSDVVAVVGMAPNWPATVAVARRCGVRVK